jgi:nanoRNase/pAp phosphatase (c-di-AMP/oligoRNAs hydrolase)
MAQVDAKQTKISLRIAGKNPRKDVDLRNIIKEITSHVGGEFGGHKYAAGAIIDIEKEDDFIEEAKRVLSKAALEEQVE